MNAMTKSVVCMAALAAVRMAFGAAAYGPNLEDLTVARDATVAIDAVSYYGNATVRGTLNVNENLYLVTNDNALASTTLALGAGAGDNARVEIAASKFIQDKIGSSDRYTLHAVVGANGGCGKVVLNQSANLRCIYFEIAAAATCDGDVMDVFELGKSSYLWLKTITNENLKPARLRWTGADGYISPRAWGTKLFNLPNKENEIILEGSASCPIRINGTDQDYYLINSASKGRLRFCGGGDVSLEAGFYTGGNARKYVILSTTNIVWESIRDLYFKNGNSYGGPRCETHVDNVLPWGPNVGNVYVVNTASDHYGKPERLTLLDFKGHSQKLNGLVSSHSIISNTTGTVTLTFGTDNTDGLFAADLTNPGIRPVKVGSGTLSVSNATVNTFVSTGGTIHVLPGTTFSGHLLAATNTTFVFDGGALDFETVETEGCAMILPTNTQTNHFVNASQLVAPLEKDGANYLTCEPPANANGVPLHVKAGTLRFGGTACANKFWRFIAKKSQGGQTFTMPDDSKITVTVALGNVGLFAANGVNWNGNFNSWKTAGFAVPSLPEKYSTTAKSPFLWNNATFDSTYPNSGKTNPIANGANYASLVYFFQDTPGVTSNTYDKVDISAWWGGAMYTNATLVADDPNTWETISWRLAGTAAPVCSYNLAAAVNFGTSVQVEEWELQSSPTGEDGTWETMDERSERITSSYQSCKRFCYNRHVPYLFKSKNAGWAFSTFGAVQVDAGAVLELSDIPPENIAFNALTVDLSAGGGTITRFAPAASGTLDLVGVVGDLASRVELPLTLGEVSGASALVGWTVRVNGEPSRASMLSYESGKLVVTTSRGTTVIFR